MTFKLVWLKRVLLEAGLKVASVDGWESRGSGDMGDVRGVICHHTAGPRQGNMPSLRTILDGRPDLPGPLAQLGLGRDGTWYVIAAGRCNHAGPGEWNGEKAGNTHFIGIEAENTGRANDFPWPGIQLDSYQRGVAAIFKHLGLAATCCAGHKEFALPSGRKPDPSVDMLAFRARVAALLAGAVEPLTPIPLATPTEVGGSIRPTLRRGATDSVQDIRHLQQLLGLEAAGVFGPKTEAAVREFQRQHGLVPDGIVGPTTWGALHG